MPVLKTSSLLGEIRHTFRTAASRSLAIVAEWIVEAMNAVISKEGCMEEVRLNVGIER